MRNMKNVKNLIKVILPSVIIGVPLAIHAQVVAGNCQYGQQTVDNVTCFGPADLEGTTVTGTVKVFGPLTMNSATVNDVTVMGEMTVNSSTIKGSTSVFGPIFSTNSNFSKDVFSATNYMELISSKISGNIIEKSSSEAAVLKMTSKSTITGNVDFSDRVGVVELDSSSQVNGSVINGTKQPIH